MRNQYKILAEAYEQVKEAETPATPEAGKKPFADNPYVQNVGDRWKGLSDKPKKAKAPKAPEPEKPAEPEKPDLAKLFSDLSAALTDDKESGASYDQFLLSLLNSTNNDVKAAAAAALNKQQVTSEEDEMLNEPHGDEWNSGPGKY